MVGGVVDDQAADDRPERRRRCRAWREIRPMLAATRSRGNSSRMIAEAEREDAAADALQDAAGDDDLERVAERGDDRAGGEDSRAR